MPLRPAAGPATARALALSQRTFSPCSSISLKALHQWSTHLPTVSVSSCTYHSHHHICCYFPTFRTCLPHFPHQQPLHFFAPLCSKTPTKSYLNILFPTPFLLYTISISFHPHFPTKTQIVKVIENHRVANMVIENHRVGMLCARWLCSSAPVNHSLSLGNTLSTWISSIPGSLHFSPSSLVSPLNLSG